MGTPYRPPAPRVVFNLVSPVPPDSPLPRLAYIGETGTQKGVLRWTPEPSPRRPFRRTSFYSRRESTPSPRSLQSHLNTTVFPSGPAPPLPSHFTLSEGGFYVSLQPSGPSAGTRQVNWGGMGWSDVLRGRGWTSAMPKRIESGFPSRADLCPVDLSSTVPTPPPTVPTDDTPSRRVGRPGRWGPSRRATQGVLLERDGPLGRDGGWSVTETFKQVVGTSESKVRTLYPCRE